MKRKPLITILIAIVLILAVVLAIMLIKKPAESSQSDETMTSTQTAGEIHAGNETQAAETKPIVDLPTANPDQYADDETFGEDDVATIPSLDHESEEPIETTEDSNMLEDEDF